MKSKSSFPKILEIVILLGVLLVSPLVSAEIQSLGTFLKGENIELKQVCSNCTYVNITSVLYPNSSKVISNVQMTKDGTDYNYTLSSTYTQTLGKYIVNGIGDLDGETTVWTYNFEVNNSGFEISTAEGLFYIFGMLIALIIFFMTLISAIKFQRNDLDQWGNKIGINTSKYIRAILTAIAWVSLLFIFGLLTSLTSKLLVIDSLSHFFNYFYRFMLAMSLPLGILFPFLFIVWIIADQNVNKKLKRGIRI